MKSRALTSYMDTFFLQTSKQSQKERIKHLSYKNLMAFFNTLKHDLIEQVAITLCGTCSGYSCPMRIFRARSASSLPFVNQPRIPAAIH